MVALYFELFSEEVDDYEDWLNSDYDEYNDFDDYYEDDYNSFSNDDFDKPLFFDNVLNSFIDSLSLEELKKYLKKELKINEERTFNYYLKEHYNKYLINNYDYIFLDKLNNKINNLIEYPNYNYSLFEDEILNFNERKMIDSLYKDDMYKNIIDGILLNEKLAIYSNYKWIAKFYKENGKLEIINKFIDTLNNYLNDLKHYSIRNNIPKSNILITVYLLKSINVDEIAKMIYDNSKYYEFVEYVIYNCNDKESLYNEYLKLIDNNYLKNKKYIPNVLLCLENKEYLNLLSYYCAENEILYFIENKTNNVSLLVVIYAYFGEVDKIWNLLNNSKYSYLLLYNIDSLKDKYNIELFNHFIKEFYNTLNDKRNRDTYHNASKYINAIYKLNDGETLVNNIIDELKNSDFSKCTALFDEINKAKFNYI